MRTLQKNPRTLRPNKFIDTRALIRKDMVSLEMNRLSKVETLKTDPIEFFRQILGVSRQITKRNSLTFSKRISLWLPGGAANLARVLRLLEFCSTMR